MTPEGNNDDQAVRATGPALREYLDENAESTDSLSHFNNGMARLLADRLDGSSKGADPQGYVIATHLLLHDCMNTGVSGFGGEPMPRDVTGQPPMMYGMFQTRSIELAREAFGDTFADGVEAIYAKQKESRQAAEAEKPEEPAQPELTAEQVDHAFSIIAKGDTKDLDAIDRTQAYEVLKKIEGVDPVGAIFDGHPEDIPEEGWIVTTDMDLGSSAVISVFRYNQSASFGRSQDSGDTRERYGSASTVASLKGYEKYDIIYETPDFPQSQRALEPFERTTLASYVPLGFDRADVTDLGNGGRIVDRKETLRTKGGYGPLNLGWTDIDRLAEKDGTTVDMSRVTDDPEAMKRIVGQMGYAMGMDGQSVETLLKQVEAKTQGDSTDAKAA